MIRIFTKSIGRKLSLSFAAILLFMLVVGVTGVASILIIRENMNNVLNVNLGINQHTLNGWVEMLQAQHHIEDYLLQYSTLGAEKAQQQDVDPALQHLAALHDEIKALIPLDTAKGHLDDVTTERGMLTSASAFQANFQELTKLFDQRGITDNGVIGDVHKSANDLETRFLVQNNPALEILMLQMRSSERDYMFQNNPQDADRVRSLATQIKSAVATSNLGESQITEIQTLLSTYVKDFEAYETLNGDIAQQIASYRKSAATISEPLARYAKEGLDGVDEAKDVIDTTLSSALVIVVVTMIIAIVIGVVLAFSMTRAITIQWGRLHERLKMWLVVT